MGDELEIFCCCCAICEHIFSSDSDCDCCDGDCFDCCSGDCCCPGDECCSNGEWCCGCGPGCCLKQFTVSDIFICERYQSTRNTFKTCCCLIQRFIFLKIIVVDIFVHDVIRFQDIVKYRICTFLARIYRENHVIFT